MLRVISEWSLSPGSPYYTTMYFGGSTSGEATAAANAVRAYWEAMKGFLAAPNTITVQPDVPSVDVATGSIIE
ncbi:MAG: hypothetical protein O7C59_10085, partial [Rickettsia endosymbiont of Ixodes persulcatus]|nr:hypothetical protein [Rickettsia endosymbiont of Ixodes persulcatus]